MRNEPIPPLPPGDWRPALPWEYDSWWVALIIVLVGCWVIWRIYKKK
jgi:hypothetical protein